MTEDEFELNMPFVLCETNGGPYPDHAFVAGYVCGAIDTEMRLIGMLGAVPHGRYITEDVLPQVDLIAMNYGYTTLRQHEYDADGWIYVIFEPSVQDTDDVV